MTQDIFNQLDDATTVVTGTQLSEFYIDLGADGGDVGQSPNLVLRAHVQAAAAMAAAAKQTIEVQLVSVPGLPYELDGTTQSSKSTDTVAATGATNHIDLTAHGLTYGDYVSFGTNATAGLVTTTIYRVVEVVDADNFKVADTLTGTPAISGDDTGIVMTRYPTGCTGADDLVVDVSEDDVDWVAHGLSTGDQVEIGTHATSTGITAGRTYWVIAKSVDLIQFASTYDNAMSNTALAIGGSDGVIDVAQVPIVHATTGPRPVEFFSADAIHSLRVQQQPILPLGQAGPYRYLFARFVLSSVATGLTVQAHIGLNEPASRSFGPSGFTVGV